MQAGWRNSFYRHDYPHITLQDWYNLREIILKNSGLLC